MQLESICSIRCISNSSACIISVRLNGILDDPDSYLDDIFSDACTSVFPKTIASENQREIKVDHICILLALIKIFNHVAAKSMPVVKPP